MGYLEAGQWICVRKHPVKRSKVVQRDLVPLNTFV